MNYKVHIFLFILILPTLSLFAQINNDSIKNQRKLEEELGLPYWECNPELFKLLGIDNSKGGYNLTGLNPLMFTKFFERRNGYKKEMSNDLYNYRYSRYYIKPTSKLIVSFDQCFLKDFNNYFKDELNRLGIDNIQDSVSRKIIRDELDIKIELSAFIKTIQGNIIPVSIFGYFDVIKDGSPQSGIFLNSNDSSKVSETTNYNYTIRSHSELVETEIDLNNYSFVEGDQIVVIVRNKGGTGNGVAYTMTFEVEKQGWQHGPSSQLAFIKSAKTDNINYSAGVSLSYNFYNKSIQGKHTFLRHLLVPSFGPSLVALSQKSTNNEETLQLGFGLQISTLFRSVTLGYGSFLNYPGKYKDRQYFFIGLNFIEGIQSIRSAVSSTTSSTNQ